MTIECEGAIRILLHGFFTDFPNKIPCQHIGNGITQCFHISLVDIAGFRRTHIGHGIILITDFAFFQEICHDLILSHRVIENLTAAETILFICKELIQRDNAIVAGDIGGNMVRIGNTDIGGGVGGEVRDDILIDGVIVREQFQGHIDIGVNGFKIRHCLCINFLLGFVVFILCPECDLIRT